MEEQSIQEAVEEFVAGGGGGEDLRFGLDEGSGGEVGAGVFDEGLGGFGGGFEMELQADGAAVLEGLMGTGDAAGEG